VATGGRLVAESYECFRQDLDNIRKVGALSRTPRAPLTFHTLTFHAALPCEKILFGTCPLDAVSSARGLLFFYSPQGVYKLPWDMTNPSHRQYNPLFVLGRCGWLALSLLVYMSYVECSASHGRWLVKMH
jgi:hypothetical protein